MNLGRASKILWAHAAGTRRVFRQILFKFCADCSPASLPVPIISSSCDRWLRVHEAIQRQAVFDFGDRRGCALDRCGCRARDSNESKFRFASQTCRIGKELPAIKRKRFFITGATFRTSSKISSATPNMRCLTGTVAENPNATPQEYGIALKELQNVLLNDRSRRDVHLSDKTRSEVRRKLIDLEMGTHQTQLMAAAKTLLLEMKAKGDTTPEDDMKLAKCQVALGNYSDAVKLLESLIGYNAETKKFDDKKASCPTKLMPTSRLPISCAKRSAIRKWRTAQDVADRVIEQARRSIKTRPKPSWAGKISAGIRFSRKSETGDRQSPAIGPERSRRSASSRRHGDTRQGLCHLRKASQERNRAASAGRTDVPRDTPISQNCKTTKRSKWSVWKRA